MGRRKFRGTLPEGHDEVVAVYEVRQGMWVLDPETGEWANVKQAGRGNVCAWGRRTWRVSLRKLGEREFSLDEVVTVRVPRPRTPGDDDADTETDRDLRRSQGVGVPTSEETTVPEPAEASLTTETYRRDDGWEVVVTHDGEVVTALNHLPMIVQAPPQPLTIEYVRRACQAHGYGPVGPVPAPENRNGIEGLPTFTEAQARSLSSLSSLSDVPVFDPAHGQRVVAMEDICPDEDTSAPASEEPS